MSNKPLKPGQSAPASGQYGMFGPRGRDTGVERTVVKGETLPPTLQPGMTFKMVDATKTKGRR
ncbi:YjzC family protein [Demequina sp. B12]|uniref:YjzC family protein n=1 Tax=Demequina sp. B12 TaxID=2992757 RepID=UPI00237BA088|nr:YjzC family protein [Demequina sp. B12]MDE0572164.1 YjzC family protein [Demequina sp. B12]